MIKVVETRKYSDGETDILVEIRDDGTIGIGIVNVAAGTVIGSAKGVLGVKVLEQLAALARDHATPESQALLARLDGDGK
ncbi:MAG TPA: hypothetical protein VGG74_21355 [Kofleriaceae bacterium]